MPEHLRPWLESGLEHVFHPGGPVAAEAVAATPAQALPLTPQPPAQSNHCPVPAQTSSVPEKAARQDRAVGASRPTPEAFREPTGSSSASAGPAFPEPWASYLKLVAPGHKMVWTYMELGLDLGGQKDERRRAVVANLIRHLRLPPRPVAFWPVAALQSGRLVPDRELFWRGWRLWKTPHVVCFGRDALRVILPEADPARSMHMLRDVMVHVLPSMGELVAMLPHEQQLAVSALANLRF
ncbi:hypothetical protein [Pseudodesulfovibrio sp.]|uniref:hypothetical protein n=1 Tax=Pseudodesulfovibrio sp. TaxID=2035812 RepID=UPI00261A3379|nr:hypothetical protein [Pseudodesulfovibrio sp.]MDD3310510.1 hypothetical protein [Pseudodesulfovibrio sp.]